MSRKLLEYLLEPAQSGVYRIAGADALVDALRGSPLALARIDLQEPVFDAFSRGLELPAWFGRNWDALEDCLSDLSWREAAGHVLLLEGWQRLAQDERGTLIEVLAAAAEFWAGQRRPFFAVFVDPAQVLEAPELLPAA